MFGGLAAPLAFLLASNPTSEIFGDIRVEILSDSLVRIEKRGPKGFEDRPTFNVVERESVPVKMTVSADLGVASIVTKRFRIGVPDNAKNLSDVSVWPVKGARFNLSDKPVTSQFLPEPGKIPATWQMSDNPRMVPPAWGATPSPSDVPGSGWDRGNDSPDTYVFFPKDYSELRKDFLKLTGAIEKPPLYAFGFIDSRYHPYTESEAVGVIDKYRDKRIPLDLFTVDTDWRVNGSHGYTVDTNYFPDMGRFLKEAHDRNVRIMFNDHPEPVAKDALDPAEMKYRYTGLTTLLGMGVDVWWFDRNWSKTLNEPMPGLAHEEWGQRVYHDMTQRFRPDQRPLIMTNFQGIDNGYRRYAPQPAGHRYPIWWTGDTQSRWEFLRRGVQNGVDMGVLALSPYVGEDLGGHVGQPSPELYVRYLQYGCLSPTTRIHCTRGQIRYPWEFGPEAEGIVTDFIRLRYRLLPTIYSAAERAFEDGTPILRRCDLEWPQYAEAAKNDQYMLGDDLLVAPIVGSDTEESKPILSDGFKAQFFRGTELQGSPLLERTDKQISFEWGERSPDPKVPNDNFSARWTGQTDPVSKTGDYTFVTRSDDGVRLWVDGKKVIDAWVPQYDITQTAKVHLEAGARPTIRLEYFEGNGGADVSLGWVPPSEGEAGLSHRAAWIPPGTWRSVYTGAVVEGPRTVEVGASLSQCPMWVRDGALVTLAPNMDYTGQKPWDELTLEAWVPSRDGRTERLITEDDGISNDYRRGGVSRTKLELSCSKGDVQLKIGTPEGAYRGMPRARKWLVRLVLPAGAVAADIRVDGKPVRAKSIPAAPAVRVPFLSGESAAANANVCVVEVPAAPKNGSHTIRLSISGSK